MKLHLFYILAGALPPTVAAIGSIWTSMVNRKKLEVIHVLVNSRLEQALKRIAELEDELFKSKKQNPTATESESESN